MFLLNSRAKKKYLLLKTYFEHNNEYLTLTEISQTLNCHPATAKTIIEELNTDIGKNFLKKIGSLYTICNKKSISSFDYYCYLAKNDQIDQIITELLFSSKKHSLDTLAQKLYMSKSSTYNLLKHLNSVFHKIRIRFVINKFVTIVADKYALINLIFELNFHKKTDSKHIIYENITKQIYDYYGIQLNTFQAEYYQLWLKSFTQYQSLKKNRNIKITEFTIKSAKKDLNSFSNDSFLVHQMNKMRIFFKHTTIDSEDYLIMLSGLFFSTIISTNSKKTMKLYNLYISNFNEFFDENTFACLQQELFRFFGIEKTDKKNYCDLSLDFKLCLINHNLYKLRFNEFVNNQMLNHCPSALQEELLKLPTLYSIEDINVFVNIIWFLFNNIDKKVNFSLHKKVVIKSIFGSDREKNIKKWLVNNLILNDENDDLNNVLYIVDDDRLLNDSSVNLETFLNKITNL